MAVYHIDYEKVSSQISQMNEIVAKMKQKYDQVIALEKTLAGNWEGEASQQTRLQINRLAEEFFSSIQQMKRFCNTVEQIAERMLEEDKKQAQVLLAGNERM